jgi:hypothetical protein
LNRLRFVEAELVIKEQFNDRLSKENKFLRRKDRKRENEFNILRSDHELLLMKYNDLIKENNTLKLFQEQSIG